MTRFYWKDGLEKFIAQNDAVFTGDFVEGCLINNFVLACNRGYAFFYEHATTTWTSDYYVEFVPYNDRENVLKLWDKWHKFEKEMEETA